MDGYPIWPPWIPNSDEEQRSKFLLYGALVFEWVWKCKNQTVFENEACTMNRFEEVLWRFSKSIELWQGWALIVLQMEIYELVKPQQSAIKLLFILIY